MNSIKLYSTNFNTIPSFGTEPAEKPTQPVQSDPVKAIPQQPAKDQMVKTEEKKEKVGPIQKFKYGVAAVKTFFKTINEYTTATFAGVGKGFIAGCITYGSLLTVRGVKKLFKKEVKSGKGSKIASILIGIATLGISLYNASKRVSKYEADMDHEYRSGHMKK